MTWPFAHLWDKALTYEQFVGESTQHCEMWTGVYRTARISDEFVAAATALGRRFRLLTIVEDWCGDATNTVPVIVRWVERLSNAEIRLVRRDEHPDLMDAYLTGTSRSIPPGRGRRSTPRSGSGTRRTRERARCGRSWR